LNQDFIIILESNYTNANKLRNFVCVYIEWWSGDGRLKFVDDYDMILASKSFHASNKEHSSSSNVNTLKFISINSKQKWLYTYVNGATRN